MSRRSRKAQSLARTHKEPTQPSNVFQLRGETVPPADDAVWRQRTMASGFSQMDYVRLMQGFDKLDSIAVNSTDGFRRQTLAQRSALQTLETGGPKPNKFPDSIDPPVAIGFSEWNAETIQNALIAHELGLFNQSAMLCDSMVGDARISHAINVRCKGFLNRNPYMLPPKRAKDQKLAKYIAAEQQEIFNDIITPEIAETTMFRQPLMGFALFNTPWEENQGLILPRFRHYHETWTWFNMAGTLEERVLQVIAMGGGDPNKTGNIPVTDDDEDWFLFAPFGKYRGWMRGAVQQVAIPWLVRNLALRDWARLSEVHGIPIRLLKVPANSTEEDKARLFSSAQDMGNEAVFILPVAGDGSGFSLEMLELKNTKSWEVMSELGHRCDSDIEIALAGTQLVAALGDQSSGGKSSSMAASKTVQKEQDNYSEQDGKRFSQAYREGPMRRIVLYNYGPDAEDCVPIMSLSEEAPEDKAQNAKAFSDLSTAFLNFATAGVEIDLEVAREEFGNIITGKKIAPLQTAPQLPAGTDPKQLPAHNPGDSGDSEGAALRRAENRGSMVVQLVAFDKDEFTLDEAKAWLESHNMQATGSDGGDGWRFEQRDPKDFNADSYQTVSVGKGIQFVIGRLDRDLEQPTEFGNDQKIMRRSLELMRPHIDRLNRIFERATSPEELKREHLQLAERMRTQFNEIENRLNGVSPKLDELAPRLTALETELKELAKPKSRHPRAAHNDAGQAYVDEVALEALKHAPAAMSPLLERINKLIAAAEADPDVPLTAEVVESLKKSLKQLARETKRGHLEELVTNSRLLAHMAGRVPPEN